MKRLIRKQIVNIPENDPVIAYKKLTKDMLSPYRHYKYEPGKAYQAECFKKDYSCKEGFFSMHKSFIDMWDGEILCQVAIWGRVMLINKMNIESEYIKILKTEKYIKKMEFYIEGKNAEKAAHEFSAMMEKEFSCKPVVSEIKQAETGNMRSFDPVAVASLAVAATALLVSIPAGILSAMDLVQRIKNKKQAETIIDCADKINAKHGNVIRIKTDNKLITVHTSDPGTLINIASS